MGWAKNRIYLTKLTICIKKSKSSVSAKTLMMPITPHSSPQNQQGTQRKLTDRLLLAHWKSDSCSSTIRREQTLIPQGAHWQSDRQGLTVCIKEITCHLYKTRFQAMRADEPMATSEGYLILSRQKSIPSPYWLNGTLLPDVWPTAGKCQADSREQSGV